MKRVVALVLALWCLIIPASALDVPSPTAEFFVNDYADVLSAGEERMLGQQAENLYHCAVEKARLTGQETVLDLYCGTGTITLAMARHAREAIGVEVIPSAVEDAKENAIVNGLPNTRFLCADAGQAAAQLAAEGLAPDVIVVDPPRKGLSLDAIEAMAQMAPQKIVYASCDPATLARDAKLLQERGYRAVHAQALDLFPRCAHVESVLTLIKSTEV